MVFDLCPGWTLVSRDKQPGMTAIGREQGRADATTWDMQLYAELMAVCAAGIPPHASYGGGEVVHPRRGRRECWWAQEPVPHVPTILLSGYIHCHYLHGARDRLNKCLAPLASRRCPFTWRGAFVTSDIQSLWVGHEGASHSKWHALL